MLVSHTMVFGITLYEIPLPSRERGQVMGFCKPYPHYDGVLEAIWSIPRTTQDYFRLGR